MRCCAVLHCAFFRTYSTWYHAKSTRYQVLACSCIAHTYFLFHLIVPFRSCFFSYITPVPPRSERGIANKHIAQHRPIRPTQVAVGVINSLVAPNHGPLIAAPFPCSGILPCASVAGRRQPPAERSPCINYKVPLRDGVDLRPRGRRKSKWGNTAVPMTCMSYCFCCSCYALCAWYGIRRCVLDRCIGRENVTVI